MQKDKLNCNFPSSEYTGFSAAGTDFRQKRLSLDELIIKNPAATYFLEVEEQISFGQEHIVHAQDILVVDRSAAIKDGSLVVAVADGEMVLRRARNFRGRLFVPSHCPDADPDCAQETDIQVWGKVIYVLHPVSP